MFDTIDRIVSIIFLSTVFILVTTVGLSCIFVGQNNEDAICDHVGPNLIRLYIWLTVTGSVLLFVGYASIVLLLLYLLTDNFSFLICYGVLTMIDFVYIIVWTIIGSYQFFAFSGNCQFDAFSLWIMTIIALIFLWVSAFRIIKIKDAFIQTKN